MTEHNIHLKYNELNHTKVMKTGSVINVIKGKKLAGE